MMGMMQPPMYLGSFCIKYTFFTYFFVWANTGLTVQWLCKVAAVLFQPRMCKGGPGPLAAPGNMKARARVLPRAKWAIFEVKLSDRTETIRIGNPIKNIYFNNFLGIIHEKIRAWHIGFQHGDATPRAVCLAWVRAQCLPCQVGFSEIEIPWFQGWKGCRTWLAKNVGRD